MRMELIIKTKYRAITGRKLKKAKHYSRPAEGEGQPIIDTFLRLRRHAVRIPCQARLLELGEDGTMEMVLNQRETYRSRH